ncbi:hypothetical protein [Lampropedia hyalina]|jgi:hypothetical protein|uniref:hypothetical protein n=1 Tax=Lampropedia hyalina TaxID=198706 RepID=UPI0011612A36|nr:hypothetical protein [Lampropedia hyalina]
MTRPREGLQNPLRRPHPATGRIAALAFAVNSSAIDRKIRLALHPTGGRGLTARVLQTFPSRNGTYLSLFPVIPGLTRNPVTKQAKRNERVFSQRRHWIPTFAGMTALSKRHSPWQFLFF